MRQEIADCLDLVGVFPKEILTERLMEYLISQDEQIKVKEERENSMKGKHKIPQFPQQDSFWYIKEVTLEHKDLSHLRMLVLLDSGLCHSSTVQFSLLEASRLTYKEQAMQLLCQGCFYPLDRRRSRRPRFLYLMDSNKASSIQLNTDDLGIHFCESKPSKDDLGILKRNFQNTQHFRQCSVCGVSGTPDLFYDCDKCGAILYCRLKCQGEDWEESHQAWCLQFKQFMTVEADLADLPFDFACETTQRDFDDKKWKEFLQKHGVEGQGLWSLEFPNSHQALSTFLQTDDEGERSVQCSTYGLELESSLLEIPPQPADGALCGWRDYYSFRGFPTNSVISILLHFPLTVYFIVSQLLPEHYHETFTSIQQSKKLCIHLIGAEKEVKMFYPFLECARLLFPISVHIHLFGNNFDKSVDKQVITQENLHFQIHKGIYHRANHEHIPSPDLAVCLNGGIGAYTSYIKTVKCLTRKEIPFYYTDYGQASIAFSSNTIVSAKAGYVSQPIINPFRCPLRMTASDQNLPRYSNAFITRITAFLQNMHLD